MVNINELKVGDRVRGVGSPVGHCINNELGTVKEIDVEENVITINFDNPVGFWGDEDLGIAKKHGLCVESGDIERVQNNENDKIYFAKVKLGAIIPSKREEDGCYDIHACFEQDEITILPGEIKMIPTGISSAFSPKFRIGFRERGSTGTIGASYKAGQIDSGYRNEWFVPINNTQRKPIVISKLIGKDKVEKDYAVFYPYNKAIVSAALEEVPVVEVIEISAEELQAIPSERGNGCLGSSGK